MSLLQEAGHIKHTVVLIFRHILCLHLMNSEVAWVLLSSGTQVQPQVILDPDYLPDYLSVSYDYDLTVHRFFVRVQSPTCTTYRKCLLERIMALLTPKSAITTHFSFLFACKEIFNLALLLNVCLNFK